MGTFVEAMTLLSSFANLLIRVPNWLGDSLMATPAVAAVREMLPEAKITILCKPAFSDFWKNFPGIEEVFTLQGKGLAAFERQRRDLKSRGFDAALIFPTSFSSAFLPFSADIPVRIGWGGEGRDIFLTSVIENSKPRQRHLVWEYLDLVAKGLGKPAPARTYRLLGPKPTETQNDESDSFLRGSSSQSFIALAPGATYGPAKRWPLERWVELSRKILDQRSETLVIVGGKEESDYLGPLVGNLPAQRVRSLIGRTSVPVLGAVLERCKVLVTNDTGPMHVAAAVGTPTVALFGSTSPIWTAPFGRGHEVIYKQAECSPCFQRTCPVGYHCLTRITVEEVFQAAQRILEAKVRVSALEPPKEVFV